MKIRDLSESLKDFWHEFRQVKSGLIGLVLLGLFLFAFLFEGLIIPFKDTNDRWRDITYWEDNPKGAAPIWLNWFSSKKYSTSKGEYSGLQEYELCNCLAWDIIVNSNSFRAASIALQTR